MVQVSAEHPTLTDGSIDIDTWVQDLPHDFTETELDTLKRACHLANEAMQSGSTQQDDEWVNRKVDAFRTGLDMAVILTSLGVQSDALVAAVLYRCVRENKLSITQVKKQFSQPVTRLIEGVLQMAAISRLQSSKQDQVFGETYNLLTNVRKMLVSLVDDVQVALIKLAERTCAIRTVKHENRKRRYLVSREVFDVYAPLAHRLGIGTLKWELEDLSFRYLQPVAYKQVAHALDERRLDRQQYIDTMISTLEQSIETANIKADISGRAKHIYSIWRKMQRKNIEFSQVYDVRALRVLVPTTTDCYTALGIIHGLWRNIPREFDDYIANPKENGYRSLHTAVFGPEGKAIEIQIRTHQMHDEAELGVCAHWLYKGTDTNNNSDAYENKLSWLRQVLEWHEEVGDNKALVDQVSADIEQDRIYVFTPKGHVVDLPHGSTPVDFAYRVHTEIGHTCRGATIHGHIAPLTSRLKTGDQISILTKAGGTPSRDWLNPNLGYVNSGRTRAKISHFFKQQDKDKNTSAGRQIVERELRRMALGGIEEKSLAQSLNFKHPDDMYAALGAGDLRLAQIVGGAQRQLEPQLKALATPTAKKPSPPLPAAEQSGAGDIFIDGISDLLTQIAQCCQPQLGDAITGYITLGRGVSVHKADCHNVLNLTSQNRARIINVAWTQQEPATFPVDIIVEAFNRTGIISDVASLIGQENINLRSITPIAHTKANMTNISITVDVPQLDILGRLMDKITLLANVLDVRRST